MKHLKIEQSTSSIEVVDPKVIDKLYNLVLFHPVGESLDSTSNLKGNLLCSHAYGDVVDYLTTNYKDLSISVTGGIYIRFEDKNVETTCATNWGDGTGITSVQASVVNSLNSKFANNTSITKFDELKYFINYTVLEGWAFLKCTALTSIDLSNITKLGCQTFSGCSALKSVNLSSKCIDSTNWYGTFTDCVSLTDVGDISGFPIVCDSTFNRCTSLVSVNLSSKCTAIGSNAFRGCTSLVSVGDTSGITTIGDYGMAQCSKLATINITSSCTSIGNYAFNNDVLLTSIGDLSGVTTLGYNAFYGCTSLIDAGNLTALAIVNDSVFNSCTNLKYVALSNTCKTLVSSAFKNCTNLLSVGDLSGVTAFIGDDSIFYHCTKLTNVNLSSLVTCTNNAFDGCSALTSITDIPKLTKAYYRMFADCISLSDALHTSSLTYVDLLAFVNTKITNIDLTNVTTINICAFYNCTNLQIELNAPNLTTLVDTNNNTDNDHGAFNGSGITSIKNLGTIHTIPIGYPQSDRGQFGNCPNLVHVNLPATLTYIGEYSFYNCPNLTSVICLPTTPPVLDGTNVFTNANALLKIYVPDDSVNAYKSATNWSTYASRIYSMTQFDIDHPKTRA